MRADADFHYDGCQVCCLTPESFGLDGSVCGSAGLLPANPAGSSGVKIAEAQVGCDPCIIFRRSD